MKRSGPTRSLAVLLMPLVLLIAGAGIAVLGAAFGSLVVIVAGLAVGAAGALWAVVMLDLANPFEWF